MQRTERAHEQIGETRRGRAGVDVDVREPAEYRVECIAHFHAGEPAADAGARPVVESEVISRAGPRQIGCRWTRTEFRGISIGRAMQKDQGLVLGDRHAAEFAIGVGPAEPELWRTVQALCFFDDRRHEIGVGAYRGAHLLIPQQQVK
jgi:hypothetical protein